MSWRTACIGFAVLAAVLAWRSCARPTRAAPTAEACAAIADDAERDDRTAASGDPWSRDQSTRPSGSRTAAGRPAGATDEAEGPAFSVPAWIFGLAPQPGESLLAYRDRIVPLAQQAIAPQRDRVARGREAFAAAAGLDARQRAELDAAVAEAADAIQGRLYEGVLGGDLMPSRFKPMAGVGAARDVLDAVDRANQRFLGSLREDQRAALARHPFDLADYLLFSTRWEDAIGYSP
jgi:hypothetical protein